MKHEKHYGNEPTHLTLTEKAYAVYSNSFPLDIYERETEDGYTYRMTGAIVDDELTADDVNELLETLGEEE